MMIVPRLWSHILYRALLATSTTKHSLEKCRKPLRSTGSRATVQPSFIAEHTQQLTPKLSLYSSTALLSTSDATSTCFRSGNNEISLSLRSTSGVLAGQLRTKRIGAKTVPMRKLLRKISLRMQSGR